MKEDDTKPKIGAGHAGAMLRLGLAELRAASFPDQGTIAQPEPYGLYGTLTPMEVVDAKNPDSRDPEQEKPSVLEERLDQVGQMPDEPELETPDMERD